MDLLSKSSPTGKDFSQEVRLDLDTITTAVDPLLAIEHVLNSQLKYDLDNASLITAEHLFSEYVANWPHFGTRKKAVALAPFFEKAAEHASAYADVMLDLVQNRLYFRKQPLWDCRRHVGRHVARAEIAALAVEAICVDDESRRTDIAKTIVGYACTSATASGVMVEALVQLIEEEKKLLSLELHPIVDEVVEQFWPEKWDKARRAGIASGAIAALVHRFKALRVRAEYRASLKK